MDKKKGENCSGNQILWILVILIFIIITGGIIYKLFFLSNKDSSKRGANAKHSNLNKSKNSHQPKIVYIPEVPEDEHKSPKIAIIIDDLGWNMNVAESLLSLNAPFTLSILPELEYSLEIAELAANKGLDVLLHMPMEPNGESIIFGSIRPITVSMNTNTIIDLTTQYIRSIPNLVGVNNHQGSRFTENMKGMTTFINILKGENLFFVDSRTTPKTVGFKIAKAMGLKTAERHVFLDNDLDREYIEERIKELERIALKKGVAIGIGHPHRETIMALREIVSRFEVNNIDLVPVSKLVH